MGDVESGLVCSLTLGKIHNLTEQNFSILYIWIVVL